MLAIMVRGLLPSGVMLAHDGQGGLTVALCSGGQIQINAIGDEATPLAQLEECAFALAALPALPSVPQLGLELAAGHAESPVILPQRVTLPPAAAPPPARGPPLVS